MSIRTDADRGWNAGSLKPGDVVGDYVIQTKLGQGGMGEVFRAEQPLIKARVAIKVLSHALASDPEAVNRLRQEATAVNVIDHPNIVRIFNFGQLSDGRHYFVMEYLDGLSLRGLLSRSGPPTVGEAVRILKDVARALDAAHDAGVLHRDIKPDNIFLTRDETGEPRRVKLLDFGIAKVSGEPVAPEHRTRTSVIMGSPDYMSPEQCHSMPLDRRADLYSLGVVAYEMLTGDPPFKGDSPFEMMMQHVTRPAMPPSRRSTRVPAALDAPILQALAKLPDDRFERAMAFAEALEAAWRLVPPEFAGLEPAVGRSREDRGAAGRPLTGRAGSLDRPGDADPPLEDAVSARPSPPGTGWDMIDEELEPGPGGRPAPPAPWEGRAAHEGSVTRQWEPGEAEFMPASSWEQVAEQDARTSGTRAAVDARTSGTRPAVDARTSGSRPAVSTVRTSGTRVALEPVRDVGRPFAARSEVAAVAVAGNPGKRGLLRVWLPALAAVTVWVAATSALELLALAILDTLPSGTPGPVQDLVGGLTPVSRRIAFGVIGLVPARIAWLWLVDWLRPVSSHMTDARCPACGWRGRVTSFPQVKPVCPRCTNLVERARVRG